jgi:aminobenzoyl-glutamate transport protein
MSTGNDPATSPNAAGSKKTLLDRIERVGNALPDPMTLFVIGTVIVFVASWIMSGTGYEARLEIAGKEGTEPRVFSAEAWNLASQDGFRWLLDNLITIFTGFAPLGLVLVAAIGIAIAEKSGLIAAALKLILLVVPASLLTPATFFAGVMSSMAVDAGYIVLPPLAAAVYRAVGRSPLVGLAAVFAGVASGFNANLFITGLDPMLAGMTQEGARMLDSDYVVNPACNWWFMIASTALVTAVGWLVTVWIVEPRLATKSPEEGGPGVPDGEQALSMQLEPAEKSGLVAALVASLVTLGFLFVMYFAPWGFLYDPEGSIGTGEGQVPFPTWIRNLVPLLLILFLVPGLVFGYVTKSIRSDRDVVRMMTEYMEVLGNYIVLAFFASIFVAAFGKSELGKMVAIDGGAFLRDLGLSSSAMMIAFIVLIAFLNLFVGSMSAKWAMLSVVFVPMFMTVGISPELTQSAYRIGDSVSNCITPLNSYLIIVLVYMQQFAKKSGMGSLIALMLPYSIALLIAWCALLAIWIVLGLPLGIDGGLVYELRSQG